jgi:hypothetical protein
MMKKWQLPENNNGGLERVVEDAVFENKKMGSVNSSSSKNVSYNVTQKSKIISSNHPSHSSNSVNEKPSISFGKTISDNDYIDECEETDENIGYNDEKEPIVLFNAQCNFVF